MAIELGKIADNGGFVIMGEEAWEFSGGAVASTGDINGDGFDDLLIGAPGYAYGYYGGAYPGETGKAFVVFGKAGAFDPTVKLADVAAGNGGFALTSPDLYSAFGRAVGGAGDVNGDGFDDIVIGAPQSQPAYGDWSAGTAYVVFGQAGGIAPGTDLQALAEAGGAFAILGSDGNVQAGFSVASAGDINGDGYDDLVVGAPFQGGTDSPRGGSVLVLLGRAGAVDATVDVAVETAAGRAFEIHAERAADAAGFAVASAGDINGDGFDDLLIGAPYAAGSDTAKPGSGAAYVLFGKAGGFGATIDLASLAAGNGGFVMRGVDAGDQLGATVAAAGDVNGDGLADILIGAPNGDGADPAHEDVGEAYVVYGSTGGFGAAVDLAAVASGSGGFVIRGQDYHDHVGSALAGAGDFNADGFADLVIGTRDGDGLDNGRAGAGDSWLVYGKAGGGSVDLAAVTAGNGGFELAGRDANDVSGTAVAAAGDINGDGFDDLLIGAPGADGPTDTWEHAGETYVVLGRDTLGVVSRPGTAASELLTGSGNPDVIVAGAGNDTLVGAGGVDRLDGGRGIDTADYSASASAVTVDMSTNLNSGGDAAGDQLVNIENVRGSAAGDVLRGDGHANRLDGGAGADTLAGAAGDDTYVIDTLADTIIELAGGGSDTVRSPFSFSLAALPNVENIVLTSGSADDATGNAGNNLLAGNAVANVLDGGAGYDTASYAAAGAGVTLNLAAPGPQDTGGAGIDTLLSIEALTGSDYADQLWGDAINNVLDGGGGNDLLVAAGGNDVLRGGAGSDYLYLGDGNDAGDGGADSDVLVMETGNDTGHGGAGQDYLYLGDGDDVGFGDDGVDVLIGEAGNDTGHGGNGADYLYLGVGDDVAYGDNGNDLFVLEAGNDAAYGGAGQDYFYMGAGNDTLVGGDGVDVMLGEAGNDLFDGGYGVDYLFLGPGGAGDNDTVVVDANRSGPQVVYGFEAGGTNDAIRLVGTTMHSFADVQAAVTDYSVNGYSVLTLDGDTNVWLIGVTPAQLTASDFLFA